MTHSTIRSSLLLNRSIYKSYIIHKSKIYRFLPEIFVLSGLLWGKNECNSIDMLSVKALPHSKIADTEHPLNKPQKPGRIGSLPVLSLTYGLP